MSRRLAAVVAACALSSLFGVEFSGAAQQPSRTWLVLGDSYSSGEGIQDTPTPSEDQSPGPGERVRDCRRADGQAGNASAWAVEAHRQVGAELGIADLHFVACTGAISDEIPAQIDEATRLFGPAQWDVVTFSIGGNNIKFADIIKECIDLPPASFRDLLNLEVGCDIDAARFNRRVDLLGSEVGVVSDEYKGTAPLPPIYDIVADHVKPGGHVLVLGYPNIIEEASRWRPARTPIGGINFSRQRCDWIWRKDVELLRTGAAYLNRQIQDAVQRANQRHENKGIRFHFLDISGNPYERGTSSPERHSLCAKDPWLHSVQFDRKAYIGKSFHPNQRGYAATGKVLADYMREHLRFDGATTPCPNVGFTPNSDDVVFDITSLGVPCDDIDSMMRERRTGPGFDDRFTVRGFDCQVTGGSSSGMVVRYFRCAQDSRWFTFSRE